MKKGRKVDAEVRLAALRRMNRLLADPTTVVDPGVASPQFVALLLGGATERELCVACSMRPEEVVLTLMRLSC